jgi:hypothetical protein
VQTHVHAVANPQTRPFPQHHLNLSACSWRVCSSANRTCGKV